LKSTFIKIKFCHQDPKRSEKKHFTAQCINDVLDNLANLKALGFHFTAAVLDLSNAFDAVNIPILGSKLVSFKW